jgi:hypothetical protein
VQKKSSECNPGNWWLMSEEGTMSADCHEKVVEEIVVKVKRKR